MNLITLLRITTPRPSLIRIMKSPWRKTVTHNGTGHVALYVALGIDWNAAYGINALKDFCL